VQRPIPIVVGGHTDAAYRRALTRAHGWYGFALTPDTTAEYLAALRSVAVNVDRPAELGELEITVTPRGRLTRETAGAFAELGVDRLVVMPPPAVDDVLPVIDAAVQAVDGL
jgi:alkanesulfonate monooxygenase SsuD/methylene tetrahydromethanopterin reductase-like flavin-dependent oxidoreductase (luciferase family)